MGREVKRVPLDFDWPMETIWSGYQNALDVSVPCEACDGNGNSALAMHLHNQWYGKAPFTPEERGSQPMHPRDPAVWAFAENNVRRNPNFGGQKEAAIEREATRLCRMWNTQWCHHLNADDVAALVAADRLWDITHRSTAAGWTPVVPTPDLSPEAVNARYISGLGHDSLNAWVCIQAECARQGKDHRCAACAGEGCFWPTPELQAAYENWERTDPPAGDGYQLWETDTEGSPISPVCATPEALADWLVSHRSDEGVTRKGWLTFIQAGGWAPTAIGLHSQDVRAGVQGMVALEEDAETE
jgi:hypothetical protein